MACVRIRLLWLLGETLCLSLGLFLSLLFPSQTLLFLFFFSLSLLSLLFSFFLFFSFLGFLYADGFFILSPLQIPKLLSIISQWLTTWWHLPNVLPSDFGLNNRNDPSILEQSDTSVFRVFLGNKSVEVQILSQKRGELFFLKTTVLCPSYS